MTPSEFRRAVKRCWPHVTINIKTVSFEDLARDRRMFLTVKDDKPGELASINALAHTAGILPDGNIRVFPK
jgi:hypothetical protein